MLKIYDKTSPPTTARSFRFYSQPPASSRSATLSGELWAHIMSYNPESMQALSETCRELRGIATDEKNFFNLQVKDHPFLHFLIENSSLLRGEWSGKKMSILNRYIEVAEKARHIIAGVTENGGRYPVPCFHRDVTLLQKEYVKGMGTQPIERSVRGLSQLTARITFSDLFLAGVLLKDQSLIERFDLQTVSQPTIDFAAYFCLFQGKNNLFKMMLPHTSIFREILINNDRESQWSQDVLKTFLILAAQEDQIDIFRELLALRRPYNADRVLVELAENNCGKAIKILLASAAIDHEYIPGNGRNRRDASTPGLHTALMQAANNHHLDAFNAILRAKPGRAIDRQILEHLRSLFQNDPIEPPLKAQRGMEALLWAEWKARKQNYPNRDGIIQRLNNEITQRYEKETFGSPAIPTANREAPPFQNAFEPLPAFPLQERPATHPFLQFLIDKSSLINQHSRENVTILDRYIEVAKRARDIVNDVTTAGDYARPDFPRDAASLQTFHESGVLTRVIRPNTSLSDLTASMETVSLNNLFLAAVLLRDESLINAFNLEILDRKTVDFAAYIFLLQGQVSTFNKILPHTSIWNSENEWSQDVLKTFLILSGKKDPKDTFLKLLKKFNRSEKTSNEVFVALATNNCVEGIQPFLARIPVNDQYISDNGWNRPNAKTPGLHTALMEAANHSHLDAFNAILRAKPGKAIDRQILEHLQDLFENDHPLVQRDQSFSWNDWELRQASYPNPEARDRVIQRLKDEIAERYPPAIADREEKAAPILPPEPPFLPLNIEQVDVAQARNITDLGTAIFARLRDVYHYFASRGRPFRS